MYVSDELAAPVDQLAVGTQLDDVQLGTHPELMFEAAGESCQSGEDG
jgi:hypothetical protein